MDENSLYHVLGLNLSQVWIWIKTLWQHHTGIYVVWSLLAKAFLHFAFIGWRPWLQEASGLSSALLTFKRKVAHTINSNFSLTRVYILRFFSEVFSCIVWQKDKILWCNNWAITSAHALKTPRWILWKLDVSSVITAKEKREERAIHSIKMRSHYNDVLAATNKNLFRVMNFINITN